MRVIDFFTPLCAGQRIGIFAGSGIGKSTLLAMLARSRGFDTAVLALVGERGREVRDFLEDALKQEPRARRHGGRHGRREPDDAPAGAEDGDVRRRVLPRRGEKVLLIVDSVTRFAHATRDVALAAGEPPVARGYHAERLQRPAASSLNAPVRARKAPARSPACSPCWSTATITTIPSPTTSAARSTATSCSSAPSPTRAAFPRSTC